MYTDAIGMDYELMAYVWKMGALIIYLLPFSKGVQLMMGWVLLEAFTPKPEADFFISWMKLQTFKQS